MTDEGAGLEKFERIVVLMMENRSFDHMLGYRALAASDGDLDGLRPEMGNVDAAGTFHRVAPLGSRSIDHKALDPGHSIGDTCDQLSGGNGGFVRNFEKHYERVRDRHPLPAGRVFDPTLAISYLEADQVPVYDHLATRFAVCDRWFSSAPGPTWPNRLYALTGASEPSGRSAVLSHLPPGLRGAPIYDRPAFVRELADDDWRWYSHDPATLRLVDSRYRPGGVRGVGTDANFAYFNRTTLFERRSFLDDARRGELRRVSWVDPNFVDFQLFGGPASNDDHPPSDVMRGQELVLTLVHALMDSPQWPGTLLLITYDEHGGFFDHVAPPLTGVPGEDGVTYGVRVPALVVSPYVEEGAVCHALFDHTSIVKTILLRFAARPQEALARLGARAQHANHLGAALTRGSPRVIPEADTELGELVRALAEAKQGAYRPALLEAAEAVSVAVGMPGDADGFAALTDLQREIVGGALVLREAGLTPGRP